MSIPAVSSFSESETPKNDRRQTPRGESLPLNPDEWGVYQAQCIRLRAEAERERNSVADEYNFGQFCREVQRGGLYTRDPENGDLDFFGFLSRLTGRAVSRQTFERRMRLSDHYSLSEVLAHYDEGVDLTVLAEVTYGDARLRPALLHMAKSGASLEKILRARLAGNKSLKDRERSAQKDALNDAITAMCKSVSEVENASGHESPNGAGGKPSDADPANHQVLQARWQALYAKENAVSADARRVYEEKQALFSAQQKHEQSLADLARREAHLREQRDLFDQANQRDIGVDELLGQRLATLVQEREKIVELRQALAAEDERLAQEKAKLQEADVRWQDANERAAQVSAREAELAQCEAALQEREAQLAEREAALLAKDAEVAAREAELAGQAAEVAEHQQKMAAQRTLLEDEIRNNEARSKDLDQRKQQMTDVHCYLLDLSYETERRALIEKRFPYPTMPITVEAVAAQLESLAERAMYICRKGIELNRANQVIKLSNIYDLFRSRFCFEQIVPIIREYYKESVDGFIWKYPDHVERVLEKLEDLKEKGQIPGFDLRDRPTLARPAHAGFELGRPAHLVGSSDIETPQHGYLGLVKSLAALFAIDLNHPQAISIFGAQGSGKSLTIQSLVELLIQNRAGLNRLVRPLSVVALHGGTSPGHPSSLGKMLLPNNIERDLRILREQFGSHVEITGIPRLRIKVPPRLSEEELHRRREEYPGAVIERLTIPLSRLGISGLRILMSAEENSSFYMKKFDQMLSHTVELTKFAQLREQVDKWRFSRGEKEKIHQRLDILADYIDDSDRTQEDIVPGDLIIVDMRYEFMERDTALGLFTAATGSYQGIDVNGEKFRIALVIDEAHEFFKSQSPVKDLSVDRIRKMRHHGDWVIVASQDSAGVPKELHNMSTLQLVHRCTDKATLADLRDGNPAWNGITSRDLADLGRGSAAMLASETTSPYLRNKVAIVQMRPSVSMPGGQSQTAVKYP